MFGVNLFQKINASQSNAKCWICLHLTIAVITKDELIKSAKESFIVTNSGPLLKLSQQNSAK